MTTDLTESRLPQHHRTLFLSDLHLGAVGARADLILRFLRRNTADHYVLAGDILDIWHPLLPHWSATHDRVIAHLRQRAAAGARLSYVKGNHDPDPDSAPPALRLPVTPCETLVHEAADGRRYLVVHGDRADRRALRGHLLTRLGSRIDNGLRRFDRSLRRQLTRRPVPPHRRSAIEWLLATVNTLSYPDRGHERRLVALSRAQGLDGVICGHFHIAALHAEHGVIYANCGDWMDSFTALAEDGSGRLSLIGGRAALSRAPSRVPGLGAIRA